MSRFGPADRHEFRAYYDVATILQQLGLMPEAAAT
jgi:hypothetical protein